MTRSSGLDAGGGSPSVTSRNATAVSHKHRHAPHTLHIDSRTDIMGPRLTHFWNIGLIDPPELRKLFYQTDCEKSRLGQGGPSSLASTVFYEVPKKAKNSREAGLAKPLSKNVRRDRNRLKQDEAHYKSSVRGEKNGKKRHEVCQKATSTHPPVWLHSSFRAEQRPNGPHDFDQRLAHSP